MRISATERERSESSSSAEMPTAPSRITADQIAEESDRWPAWVPVAIFAALVFGEAWCCFPDDSELVSVASFRWLIRSGDGDERFRSRAGFKSDSSPIKWRFGNEGQQQGNH